MALHVNTIVSIGFAAMIMGAWAKTIYTHRRDRRARREAEFALVGRWDATPEGAARLAVLLGYRTAELRGGHRIIMLDADGKRHSDFTISGTHRGAAASGPIAAVADADLIAWWIEQPPMSTLYHLERAPIEDGLPEGLRVTPSPDLVHELIGLLQMADEHELMARVQQRSL